MQSGNGALKRVRNQARKPRNSALTQPNSNRQAAVWKAGTMSIRKQLYLSFGVILAMVLVLLAVNMAAVWREHDAKAAAQRSIDMTEAVSSVRFQMMQNRLHLQNYLLSGDTRDVEKMNEGEHLLSNALRHAEELVNSDKQRNGLQKVNDLEQGWATDFANPLVDRRR